MAIDESSSIQAELDCPSLGDCAREVGVCSWIFGQMRVWPLITGGTRVEWTTNCKQVEQETIQPTIG